MEKGDVVMSGARISEVSLLGAIVKPPEVGLIGSRYGYASLRVTVMRDLRDCGASRSKVLHSDNPEVFTMNENIIKRNELLAQKVI